MDILKSARGKDNKLEIILSWAMVLIWMLLIYGLSAQTAEESSRLSHSITNSINGILKYLKPLIVQASTGEHVKPVEILNGQLRQYGHGIIYMVLGILVFHAFEKTGIKGIKAILYSIIFCTVYACLDEIHQIFVPGRGVEVTDVLTDMVGAMGGVGIYSFIKIFIYVYN